MTLFAYLCKLILYFAALQAFNAVAKCMDEGRVPTLTKLNMPSRPGAEATLPKNIEDALG